MQWLVVSGKFSIWKGYGHGKTQSTITALIVINTRSSFQCKDYLSRYRYSQYKTRWLWDCLIFIMGNPITGKTASLYANGTQKYTRYPLIPHFHQQILSSHYLPLTVRATNARPLANASAFWAGRVENWPGRVDFCMEHIRDTCFRVSASHTVQPNFIHMNR